MESSYPRRASATLPRRRIAAWLTAVVASLLPPAFPAQASTALQDCTAAASQRVLVPAEADAAGEAAAVWLTSRLLHWPHMSAQHRFRLYYSADGRIVHRSGRAVAGADAGFDLAVVDTALPDALAARFPHLADGVVLALGNDALKRIDTLHRGQLLLVQEQGKGVVVEATRLQAGAALDDLFTAAASVPDLGARIVAGATAFALWAPTAREVGLCLYPGDDASAATHLPMQRRASTGVWRVRQPEDLTGRYYAYLVDVFVPGAGVVRNRVTDPYALSLGTDSQRAWIGSLDDPRTRPSGWERDATPARVAAPTDMVIYELHVRDFSASDVSVSAPNRGKYLAFTESGSVGMRHLRALSDAGVTDVHLLPVFDLASVPERGCVTPSPTGAPDSEAQQALIEATHDLDCFNWGYDPWHFTAPEGSYASDPGDGAVRVRELRAMVQALHDTGLRVGMDVVYNHTSASGQDPKSVLDRIVPGYYHRLDARGNIERSTCCENTATEHAMMAKLMIDSAVVWARDYHIDSFRFDLMGHQPRAAMLALQRAVDAARGRSVQLIGEGWNFGEVADGARFVQASQLSLGGSGIATFSDRARDAVRGGGCCDSGIELLRRQGWVNGLFHDPNAHADGFARRSDLLAAADLVRVGLAGSLRDFPITDHRDRRVTLSGIDYAGQPAGYASEPGEVVNYVENHDNPTLFDINVLKLPRATSREDRARVQLLAAATTAFSQGIAYFHAGIDTLRSKSLDRNSFDSGDWFNRIDWSYRDNNFGVGLPRRADNGNDWALLRPLLADTSIRPTPADIAWTRDAFRDLLRIRASSSLFRLRSTSEVRQRLTFPNTGAAQEPTVVAGRIDGDGLPEAGFRALLYLLNADRHAHTLVLPAERDAGWALHPVQRDPAATDARVRDGARYDAASGGFTVPARSAAVFVLESVADAAPRAQH